LNDESKGRWAWYIPHLPKKGDVCEILVGKPDGKNYLEDLGVDGKVTLK
jgi:hypothetical protein